ncbi:MAG: hypothetical protein ISR48_11085 [Alphaproteobacteria bacterium]|nr:hypothetical protein [Alphaproteobacteria bacterium]
MPPFGAPARSPFSEIQLKSLMKDDLYWNGAHPGSKPYRDMVDRAFDNAFPGPQRHDATGRAIAATPVKADPSGFHIGRLSLAAPVGEGGANRGRDLGRASRVFETLGLLDGGLLDGRFSDRKKTGTEPATFPELTSAIRGFQNMFGLKPDGLMNPGGPTARMLETTFGKNTSPAPASAASGRDPKRPGFIKPAQDGEKEKGKSSPPTSAGDDPRLHVLRRGEGKDPPTRMVLTKEDQARHDWLKKHRPDLFWMVEGKTTGADSGGSGGGDSASGGENGGSDQDQSKGGADPSEKVGPPTDKPVDRDAMYKELGFDPKGPGKGEVVFAVKNPVAAAIARDLGKASYDQAIAEVRSGKFTKESLQDGPADAFRHALWNYKMTQKIGSDAAKGAADAHEVSDPNNDGERLMDLYNNRIGRELALDPANKGRPAEEVIHEAIRKGNLQLQPFNTQQPDRDRAPSPSYYPRPKLY